MIQKSLPVPSCPGIWHICGPAEGLKDVPQDFCHLHWVDFCCMGFGHVLDSPLSLCSTWRRNGSGALVHPGNRRRQPERGFSVTFLIVPVAKLRVFPIRYT